MYLITRYVTNEGTITREQQSDNNKFSYGVDFAHETAI